VRAALAPASYRPASGLGGVRAFAGLGCGGACACSQANSTEGLGSILDNPLFWGVTATVLIGSVIVWWEAIR